MTNRPSVPYIGATLGLFLLTVIGLWLPWVRKQPLCCINGQEYVTDEGLQGLGAGFSLLDQILLLVALLAVCVILLARFWNRSPDVVLVLSGGVILWIASDIGYEYWRVDNYTPQAGLYLTIASGFLFIVLGVGSFLRYHFIPRLKTMGESVSG